MKFSTCLLTGHNKHYGADGLYWCCYECGSYRRKPPKRRGWTLSHVLPWAVAVLPAVMFAAYALIHGVRR